ncbi:MAG: hypothetical protein AAGI53_15780 [Planctomycetota bacterium]
MNLLTRRFAKLKSWLVGKPDHLRFPTFTDPPGRLINPSLQDKKEQIDVLYTSADLVTKLVIHEDQHNWAKFFSYIYLTAGLLAALALSLRSGNEWRVAIFATILSASGLMISFGFERTLNSGIGCLSNHRKHLESIEDCLRTDHQLPVVLCNRQGPTRNLLVGAPRWGMIMWIFVGLGITATSVTTTSTESNPNPLQLEARDHDSQDSES